MFPFSNPWSMTRISDSHNELEPLHAIHILIYVYGSIKKRHREMEIDCVKGNVEMSVRNLSMNLDGREYFMCRHINVLMGFL